MELQVDVWLRGTDFASTALVGGVPAEAPAWRTATSRMC